MTQVQTLRVSKILWLLAKSIEFGAIEKALGFRDCEERPTRVLVTGDRLAVIAKNRKRVAVFKARMGKEGWVVSGKTGFVKGMDDVIASLAARSGIDVMVLDNGTRLLVTFFSPIGRDEENGEYGPIYRIDMTLIRDVKLEGRRVTVSTRH